MDLPEKETKDKARSVFYCPLTPDYTWDLNNTTFSWILVIVRYIASPAAIFLNILVIAVLNKRKVMKKTSTILLTSLAVADLLGGAISMPLSATIDVLILRQVSFEHICFLVNVPDVCAMYFFIFSSLYHLTAIAWERYVAVVKWMDYKVIVTTNRIKKLAIFAWLGTALTILPPLLTGLAGGDIKIIGYLPAVYSVRYVRRKDPFAAVEDTLDRQHVVRHTHLIRTVSCDLAVFSDCAHGRPNEIMLKRSMSAPTLKECYSVSSLDERELREPYSIIVTTATIHVQTGQRDKMKKTIPKLPKDVNLSQGTANSVCDTSRSKSAKSCPVIEETILKRPRTSP